MWLRHLVVGTDHMGNQVVSTVKEIGRINKARAGPSRSTKPRFKLRKMTETVITHERRPAILSSLHHLAYPHYLYWRSILQLLVHDCSRPTGTSYPRPFSSALVAGLGCNLPVLPSFLSCVNSVPIWFINTFPNGGLRGFDEMLLQG
jgi:hypothetical protein